MVGGFVGVVAWIGVGWASGLHVVFPTAPGGRAGPIGIVAGADAALAPTPPVPPSGADSSVDVGAIRPRHAKSAAMAGAAEIHVLCAIPEECH